MQNTQKIKEQILLHACCAVCMAYPVEILKKIEEKNYEPIVYFYNPNIYPLKEYERRKQELINYCDKKNYKYIIGDYENKDWLNFIQGLEQEPEKGLRCNKCFEFRLDKTAQTAQKENIKIFTTTLTVSPHKISKNIFKAGQIVAQRYGIKFLEIDFKKKDGFKKTMELAKENNFYRQNYCGCKFSMKND